MKYTRIAITGSLDVQNLRNRFSLKMSLGSGF